MNIIIDDLTHPAVLALLNEHLADMHAYSPPESVHALDHDELRAPDVTFWTAWEGEELLGCGALKELDARHGEIKSMRTSRSQLRRGVAAAMLQHIVGVARERGYDRLSLETGSGGPFDAALRFYEKHGFEYCEPFADYVLDPFSRFMTRSLVDQENQE
jgi:putative acetyltransferase